MESSYLAPIWLPGRHAQTIFPALYLSPKDLSYRRERWDTPDQDFIDLDWIDGPPGSPLVVLFHGLESNSGAHYALALMHAVKASGMTGVVVHFRGCSGEINRQPRAYHSGDTEELDWILQRLRQTHASRNIFAVGVSLGGNVLLKWLGKKGPEASNILNAAATVSAPVDLLEAASALDRGFNKITYTRNFLKSLKVKALLKLARYPGLFDRKAMLRATTFFEFDDLYTAPVHGFRNAHHYWQEASSKPWLKYIAVPTLMINARNDPMMPEQALPKGSQVSGSVTLEFPDTGGHVGFATGSFPGNIQWPYRRILDFLQTVR